MVPAGLPYDMAIFCGNTSPCRHRHPSEPSMMTSDTSPGRCSSLPTPPSLPSPASTLAAPPCYQLPAPATGGPIAQAPPPCPSHQTPTPEAASRLPRMFLLLHCLQLPAQLPLLHLPCGSATTKEAAPSCAEIDGLQQERPPRTMNSAR